MNNPKLIYLPYAAIIGSDKIIFDFSYRCYLNYVVLEYDKPFTFTVSSTQNAENICKEPWCDNYYYTYRFLNNDECNYMIRLYQKSKDGYNILGSVKNSYSTSYQFGDKSFDKISLSNGDILFNNIGDCQSMVLFTKNAPKVFAYDKIDEYYPEDDINGSLSEYEEFMSDHENYDVNEIDQFYKTFAKKTTRRKIKL